MKLGNKLYFNIMLAASFNESMVNELNTYWYIDHYIMKMVDTETHSFFAGKVSAEDVAQVIQNKVNFYL